MKGEKNLSLMILFILKKSDKKNYLIYEPDKIE